MTTKLKYLGSGIRVVSKADLEGAGVMNHDDVEVYIDTRQGDAVRIVDVADDTATLLTTQEPEQWHVLDADELADVTRMAETEEQARLDAEAAAQAERDEIEANRIRAEEEAAAARQAEEDENDGDNG